jgi:hypothetical protein
MFRWRLSEGHPLVVAAAVAMYNNGFSETNLLLDSSQKE